MQQDKQASAERVRRLAADIRNMAVQPLEGSGRGLVIVAGGERMFTNAYVLIHVLRNCLGCLLPIEMWHFGQAEISPAMAALIEPFDIRLVDVDPLIATTGSTIHDGWQLKSFALVHSRFAEVLLLDADQVPIVDPAVCFDWPQYTQTGAVFWPDIVDLRRDNPIWPLVGLEPRRSGSFESGQVLVDRRRHAAPLHAALKLNEAADDIYQLIYGDKDTYLLAWKMLEASHALVPHLPYTDEFMLVQRDFDGNALLQHRTNAKWQYGGEPRKLPGFKHESSCLAALTELERRWSGRVFSAPDRSAAAREIEFELIAAGPFQLAAAGEPAVMIAFAPYGEIADGRAPDRRHWWVEQEGDHLRLVLTSGDRPSYGMERGADSIWRGRRHRLPSLDVDLMPVGGGSAVRHDLPGLADELLRAAGAPEADVPPQLADALALIAQAVPGIRERLRYIAATQSDPVVAARIGALSAPLAPVAHRDFDRILTLNAGYVRSEIAD